jgi:hypothetical protein
MQKYNLRKNPLKSKTKMQTQKHNLLKMLLVLNFTCFKMLV